MKKQILKGISLVMAVTLTLSLAACGTKTETAASSSTDTKAASQETTAASTEKNITLTLWHQWAAPNDGNTKPFRAVLDAWNQNNPNIKIEDDGIDGESYKTKIKTAVAANEVPDIFYAWGAGFAKPFVDANAILPLDEYLKDGTGDKLLGGALTNLTYNGKVYGLPTSLSVASLYCNKELFDNNGIKIPTTFEELLNAAKAFRAKGITPISVGEKDTWTGMYWYDILAIRAAGSQGSQDALNKTASWDSQPFKDAAADLIALVDANAFNESKFSNGYNEMVGDFTQGKAAMCFQGNWLGGSCEDEKSLVKGKIVVVPFPVLKDGKGSADEFFGGAIDAFWVSAKTDNKTEAVNAVKYITENMSNKLYEAGAGLPCWKVTGVDESKLSPLTKQTVEITKNSKGYVMWWDTFMEGKDAETHKNLVAELFAKKKTPDEFAKEMQKLNEKK